MATVLVVSWKWYRGNLAQRSCYCLTGVVTHFVNWSLVLHHPQEPGAVWAAYGREWRTRLASHVDPSQKQKQASSTDSLSYLTCPDLHSVQAHPKTFLQRSGQLHRAWFTDSSATWATTASPARKTRDRKEWYVSHQFLHFNEWWMGLLPSMILGWWLKVLVDRWVKYWVCECKKVYLFRYQLDACVQVLRVVIFIMLSIVWLWCVASEIHTWMEFGVTHAYSIVQ